MELDLEWLLKLLLSHTTCDKGIQTIRENLLSLNFQNKVRGVDDLINRTKISQVLEKCLANIVVPFLLRLNSE